MWLYMSVISLYLNATIITDSFYIVSVRLYQGNTYNGHNIKIKWTKSVDSLPSVPLQLCTSQSVAEIRASQSVAEIRAIPRF